MKAQTNDAGFIPGIAALTFVVLLFIEPDEPERYYQEVTIHEVGECGDYECVFKDINGRIIYSATPGMKGSVFYEECTKGGECTGWAYARKPN